MSPAFGFSAGDFIGAIHLVNKIRKALKQAGGASSQYQGLAIELENLSATLSHLEALRPDEDNYQHVNAIRSMAMAIKLPLQEFMSKLSRYESSLGPFAKPNPLHKFSYSARWAINFADEVEKLRALVAAKHISINLLLAIQISKAVSSTKTSTNHGFQELNKKAEYHGAALRSVQERLRNFEDATRHAQVSAQINHDDNSKNSENMDRSLVGLRHIGAQIMTYLNTFPTKIQALLQAILRSNLQSYQLLLQVQRDIAQRPNGLLESNIRFEDALGETRYLPYEYFRHWEPFEGFLKAHFKNKPGEEKVLDSRYHIMDSKSEGIIIRKEDWSRRVGPGATLSMSMIMSFLGTLPGVCPRTGCVGISSPMGDSNSLGCQSCGLIFCYTLNSGNGSTDLTIAQDEEMEVQKRQKSEDIRLYGSRPEPTDAGEVDGAVSFLTAPLQQVEQGERLTGARPNEAGDISYASVPAVDWNTGSTPLDAWLNQSAMPSVTPPTLLQDNIGECSQKPVCQEQQQLKLFRKVHINASEGPAEKQKSSNLYQELLELGPRAQTYARIITDRYPNLPGFLVLRLTQANCASAAKLSSVRSLLHAAEHRPCRQRRLNRKAPKVRTTRRKYPHSTDHTGTTGRQEFSLGLYHFLLFNRDSVNDPEWLLRGYLSSGARRQNRNHRRVRVSTKRRSKEILRERNGASEGKIRDKFWFGRSSVDRCSSSSSHSTIRNSSLYGSRVDYSSDQEPSFVDTNSSGGASSASLDKSKATFLHPLVDLTEAKAVRCDICGRPLGKIGKKAWQGHVLGDLRPYVCTFEDCKIAGDTFASRKEYEYHEFSEHYIKLIRKDITETVDESAKKALSGGLYRFRWGPHAGKPTKLNATPGSHNFRPRKEHGGYLFDCIFCAETLVFGCDTLGGHVGRHMEEIGFTVVSRPHSAWDFYSGLSSCSSYPASTSPRATSRKPVKRQEASRNKSALKSISTSIWEVARKDLVALAQTNKESLPDRGRQSGERAMVEDDEDWEDEIDLGSQAENSKQPYHIYTP